MESDKILKLLESSYIKGFGSLVCTIFLNTCYHEHEQSDEIKTSIIKMLDEIDSKYKKLPFELFDSNHEFATFYVMRDLIKNYKNTVMDFLENPDKQKLNKIHEKKIAICEVGEIYRKNLVTKLLELQHSNGFDEQSLRFIYDNGFYNYQPFASIR